MDQQLLESLNFGNDKVRQIYTIEFICYKLKSKFLLEMNLLKRQVEIQSTNCNEIAHIVYVYI